MYGSKKLYKSCSSCAARRSRTASATVNVRIQEAIQVLLVLRSSQVQDGIGACGGDGGGAVRVQCRTSTTWRGCDEYTPRQGHGMRARCDAYTTHAYTGVVQCRTFTTWRGCDAYTARQGHVDSVDVVQEFTAHGARGTRHAATVNVREFEFKLFTAHGARGTRHMGARGTRHAKDMSTRGLSVQCVMVDCLVLLSLITPRTCQGQGRMSRTASVCSRPVLKPYSDEVAQRFRTAHWAVLWWCVAVHAATRRGWTAF